MPEQFRGFQVGPLLDQFMQFQRYKAFLDEQREREAERAALQGPGAEAHALELFQHLRPNLGQNPDPERERSLRESVIARGRVRPEYQEQVRSALTAAPSLATERRKQDFRRSLALMGEKFSQQDKDNEAMLDMVSKDPALQKQFGPYLANLRAQKVERLNMVKNFIGLGFQDIMGDPEVQQTLNDTITQIIMGGNVGTTSPTLPPGMPGGSIQPPAALPRQGGGGQGYGRRFPGRIGPPGLLE